MEYVLLIRSPCGGGQVWTWADVYNGSGPPQDMQMECERLRGLGFDAFILVKVN